MSKERMGELIMSEETIVRDIDDFLAHIDTAEITGHEYNHTEGGVHSGVWKFRVDVPGQEDLDIVVARLKDSISEGPRAEIRREDNEDVHGKSVFAVREFFLDNRIPVEVEL